jgi:hypothetical protein
MGGAWACCRRRSLRCNRRPPEAWNQEGLLLSGDQPVGVYVCTIGKSGFRLFKTEVRKNGEIIRDVRGGEKVLDGSELVGVGYAELESVGFEFGAFAEAVIGSGAQDHESSAARSEHAAGFLDGLFHFRCPAVIEDTEAENSLEAVVGEGQMKHGSLRQQGWSAGVGKALAGVDEADERDVNAARREAEVGGQLGVASGTDSDVQEARGGGLAEESASRDQEPDYVVVRVGRAKARTFMKLVPMRRCVMHCKATLS